MLNKLVTLTVIGVFAATPLALAQDANPATAQDATRNQNAQQADTQQNAADAAQDARQNNRRLLQQRDRRAQQGQANVEELAAWLALGNQAEIELARLAIQKTETPDVRDFAELMIRDHTAQLQKLRQFMPNINFDQNRDAGQDQNADTQGNQQPGTRQNRPDAKRPDATPKQQQQQQKQRGESGADQADTPREEVRDARQDARDNRQDTRQDVRDNRQNARQDVRQYRENARDIRQDVRDRRQNHSDLLRIGMRAAHYKLTLNKELLNRYEGQDFDMAYLGQQIASHTEMLATLSAMQNEGSQEFQQVVQEGIQTTKQHLAKAQQLSHRFEDKERGAKSAGAQTP